MDEFDSYQMIQPITCLADSIVLSSPYPGANYLWYDGSTAQYNTVPDQGSYWVQTSMNNCQVTDTISLTDQLCFREIEMPNVFSPNGDGTNDLFLPLAYGGIIKAQMNIYNRWGKIVFSTSELKAGWDGINLDGDICAEGVYFWSINYTNKFRDTYNISGSVTLIRKP
jgi:gliding motility-associated-like protein